MIIVCNSCPAQYSVPDARVRGKLVRITCKHCAAPIVFDGREMPEGSAPVVLSAPAIATPDSSTLREDDVTLIARPKPSAFSVHDEATVIGQIPPEALAVERMLSQRTQPPPADAPLPTAPSLSPPASPRALPEMPERPDDETKSASPQAFVRRSEPPAPPAPPAPPVPPVVRDDRTLVSGSLNSAVPAPTPAVTPSRLRFALLAFVVVALGALWIATRTLR